MQLFLAFLSRCHHEKSGLVAKCTKKIQFESEFISRDR